MAMTKNYKGMVCNTETAELLLEKDYYNNGTWFSTKELYKAPEGYLFFNIYGNLNALYAPPHHIEPIHEDYGHAEYNLEIFLKNYFEDDAEYLEFCETHNVKPDQYL